MSTPRTNTPRTTTPVTVVCGPDRDPALLIARRLRGDDPTHVLLEHDLSQVDLGLVGRASERGGGRYEAGVVELAHGCVSCTMREDMLPALVDLASSGTVEHVVLLLPDVVEAAGFLEAFHGMVLPGPDGVAGDGTAADHCHVDVVVAVVRAPELIATVVEGQTLAELDRTAADADDRCLGELVLRQVETADVVVLLDASATERGLVRLLNPTARVLGPDDRVPAGLFDLDRTLDRADPSIVPAGADVRRDGDAWTVVWRARRPLHPVRLHDALDPLVDMSLRSRGTVWLAGHPDALVGWEAAGPRLSLGHVGSWLDGQDPCAWDHADPHRLVRAQLDWDAAFGDRYQEVAVTGVGDLPDVAGLLDACLVTDAELQAGLFSAPLPTDPFADVFTHSQEVS
ncbi:CobW family GTP-binding protein [Aquipuribacter sp. MA13-6]|uniref:CobW family GTP-binding protein n=1 Tax=unclassified Aquipuribacter TaxID=2635084 RepID=UPI003EEF3D17